MNFSAVMIKRLKGSDLGWFQICRDKAKGKQFGLNIDAKFMKELYSVEDLELGELPIEIAYYNGNEAVLTKEEHVIKRQAKNWRLTGKIEGEFYKALSENDFIVFFFTEAANKYRVFWEVFYQDNGSREPIFNYLVQKTDNVNLLFREQNEIQEIHREITAIHPDFYNALVTLYETDKQIKTALSSRHILTEIMGTVVSLSSGTQVEFIKVLETIVERFRYMLKDQIRQLKVDHETLWSEVKNRKISFFDGGVASLSSLGSEPIAIRVGQYTVRPGVEGEDREDFKFKTQMVDELYASDDGVYDDFSDNFPKLLDMARIYMESGAVYKSIADNDGCDLLMLHGPLVNPAAPYDDYPNFTEKTLNKLGISSQQLREFCNDIPDCKEGHFISVYYYILNHIFNSGVPVCGVIERSAGSKIVSKTLLDQLALRGFGTESKQIWEAMRENKISDTILFACLLKEGEYIVPLKIDKNDIGKSPDIWKGVIRNFPKPLTTYIKITSTSFPFRIEMSPAGTDVDHLLNFIYHMARLLPNYAFPVGLDIVDKFAKVPAWMTKQVSKEQSAQILKRALETGRTDVVELVRLYLTGNQRDWLFRPKFDR